MAGEIISAWKARATPEPHMDLQLAVSDVVEEMLNEGLVPADVQRGLQAWEDNKDADVSLIRGYVDIAIGGEQ